MFCSPVTALVVESSAVPPSRVHWTWTCELNRLRHGCFIQQMALEDGAKRGEGEWCTTGYSHITLKIMRRWTWSPSFGGSYEVREKISASGYWLPYHANKPWWARSWKHKIKRLNWFKYPAKKNLNKKNSLSDHSFVYWILNQRTIFFFTCT
jgi:hypothetical protein